MKPGSFLYPSSRRDFIRSASIAGAAMLTNPDIATFFSGDIIQINGGAFDVSIDTKKGVFNIKRKSGGAVVTNGAAIARLNSGVVPVFSKERKYKVSKFSDDHKQINGLAVSVKDKQKKLDFELRMFFHGRGEAMSIELFCKNVSSQNIILQSLEPLRVEKNEGGLFHAPGVSKCITNGEMYFDSGSIIDLDKDAASSWWNLGLFGGYDKEGIVLGYQDSKNNLGKFAVSKSSSGEFNLTASSVFEPSLTLKPGDAISTGWLSLYIADNIYSALEQYADDLGSANHARTQSILNGWCSWFYTLSKVSEEEVVNNTVFAAKHLKPYGLEYIQVDEGYQRWHGDWNGNELFPHGMKWLADTIKSQGFKAGIWISPYVISEPAEVFQKHPDWLVKGDDGKPQRVGNWPANTPPPADENPKRYCLDVTHPEAAKWLHDLIYKIVHDWGYEMIKIDFVAWSILAAKRYYDPTVSSAEAYRKGMEIMRKAAGPNCHILECGPGNTTVGMIDSMRIELDIYYGFNEAAWDTYFLHQSSSAAAAGKRYYFHKRTWINDVDHLCMDLLTHQQAEAAASIIALSGGNVFSGDRLTELDSYKLEILKKISPAYGEAAKPIDLFDADIQSAFAVKIKKAFANWTVAGFFNRSLTERETKQFSIQRLWLEPGKTYLAFDFWKQQFLGEVKDEIKLDLEPGSVCLLSLHVKTGYPQFISTDRHVMQGAIELDSYGWHEDSKTLEGASVGPLHSSHNIYIYIPEERPWTWDGSALYHDEASYSVKLVHKHIIRIHVRFDNTERVAWKISF